MELKTIKDIKRFSVIGDLDIINILNTYDKELKQEAIKWIRYIESGMKTNEDLLWEKITGNTLTYDEHYRKVVVVFIKHFFNITEEDLK